MKWGESDEKERENGSRAVLRLTVTAFFVAPTAALSAFSVPLPTGGHLYLTDAAICTAALLPDPWLAFAVGGSAPFSEISSFTRR